MISIELYLKCLALIILLAALAYVIAKLIISDSTNEYKIIWIIALTIFPLPAVVGWAVSKSRNR